MGVVTLLALRNVPPDVFRSVAVVGGRNPEIGFDAIFSAETFVSALVVGFIAAPFLVSPAPFIRDMLFYLTATLGMDNGGKLKCCGCEVQNETGIVTRPLVLLLYKIEEGKEYAEFAQIPRKWFTDFASLRKEFADETNRVTGHTKHISSVPMYLSIYSPNGNTFHLHKDNKPADLFDITSDLSLIIASGPYTTTDNLFFEPLSDLLAYAQRKQPKLPILLLQLSPDEILIKSTEVIGQRIKKVDRDTNTSATIIALASGLSESNVP
ncbi:unnamed protein product [Lactuca saligna]|uniref:Dynamin GTPase domain-containing protein n=1 Tax=Lactuca saligna TaxID=75948 RepID=A0AA35YX37_LACSI|nr:unnamed protein product [Lactuca saligna]